MLSFTPLTPPCANLSMQLIPHFNPLHAKPVALIRNISMQTAANAIGSKMRQIRNSIIFLPFYTKNPFDSSYLKSCKNREKKRIKCRGSNPESDGLLLGLDLQFPLCYYVCLTLYSSLNGMLFSREKEKRRVLNVVIY